MTREQSDTGATNAAEDADFVSRLAQGLERIERGERIDVSELCAGRPELAERLEAALRDADALPGLNAAACGIDPRIGERIADRYELRSRLGAGGMGVVYEAFDAKLQRTVAVKMLRSEFAPGGELEARFERESEVLASVQHSAIVPLFDCGRTAEGQAYFVMPRLRGRTASELIDLPPDASPSSPAVATSGWLADRLGSDEPDPDLHLDDNYVRQVVRWIARIARALHTVHEGGVIHRDIKPSNVFVRADGSPVLIDFGLVTLGPDATLAIREAVIGTPAYMAPEQLDPGATLRPTTDVYGLTATLYHLLTFARPYQGSPSQVLAALQRTEPIPASKLRPGLPRDMQAILDMGMARDPAARYPTAAVLADDLEAWLDYLPIRARPISAARRAWRRWRRTASFRATVGAVVLVALIASATAVAANRAESRRRLHLAAFNEVAPMVLIGLPDLRVSADQEAEREIGAVLDEMVEYSAEPSPARVIRAGFYLDRGKRDLAAADMQAVAGYYGTPTTRAIAERYASASDNRIAVHDLPLPEKPVDRLVLAFHLGRGMEADDQKVVELLNGRTDLLAAELAIHARIGQCLTMAPSEERRAVFRRIRDDANRLEGIRGSSSAFLERSKGTIMSRLALFREAKAHFEKALEHTDADYTIWHNLALAQQRLGDDEAGMRASLSRAIELQPASVRLHELMIEVELGARRFEAARAWIDKTPFPAGEAGSRRALLQRGHVLLARAKHRVDGASVEDRDRTESRRLASEAFECFRDARPPGSDEWTFLMLLAKCLAEPEADYKEALFEFANRDPLEPDYLASIYLVYRFDVEEGPERLLLGLVRNILETLAPGKFTRTKDKK